MPTPPLDGATHAQQALVAAGEAQFKEALHGHERHAYNEKSAGAHQRKS
jgi:hypothetical protein